MPNFFLFSLVSLLLIKIVAAGGLLGTELGEGSTGNPEFFACDELVEEYVWDYTPLGLAEYSIYYDSVCGYPPAVGTLLLCSAAYGKNDTDLMDKLFESASSFCASYSSYVNTAEWYKDQYENATTYFVPMEQIANISLPLYSPTLPNLTVGDPIYFGYQKYYFNIDAGTWFSVGIIGYFLLLILIGSIYNLIRVSGLIKRVNRSKFAKLCQKYIIYPPLLPNGNFAQYYGWKWFSALVPNRIEFIVDLFLFGLQMAFYCVPYGQIDGWFGDIDYSWQRFVADRTGIMAFGKIPLLILFAGRNNFLIYITGWSYATFLHFHKVLALWMALDALIHSVAYTLNCLGYYVVYLHDTYFACGVAATVICFVMCGFAVHTLRNHYYQWFLLFHIIFGVAFIIMLWYHCNILGWMEWLIASCCVWFFDRLVRVIRMSFFGYKVATITVMDEDLFRVEVSKPKAWRIEPGQFGYVYFASWMFWENHPFTFVCKDNKVVMFIRVKSGLTQKIWEKANANGGSIEWKICIEGAYSTPGSGGIHKMDDILYVAGGSGAPAILQAAADTSKGKLVWISHKISNVRAYSEFLKDITIDTEIYITQEAVVDNEVDIEDIINGSNSCSNSSDDKSQDLEKSQSVRNIHIFYGRPDLHKVCDNFITTSTESNVGVNACGPPRMMDDLRSVVANGVTNWDKSVNFYDELQVW